MMRNTSHFMRSLSSDDSSSNNTSPQHSSSSTPNRPAMVLRRPIGDPQHRGAMRVNYATLLANRKNAHRCELEEALLCAVEDLDFQSALNIQMEGDKIEALEKLDRFKDLVHQQVNREGKESLTRMHALLEEHEGRFVRATFATVKPSATFSLIAIVEKDLTTGCLQLVVRDRAATPNCNLHVYEGRSWCVLPPDAKVGDIHLKENIVLVSVKRVAPPTAVPNTPQGIRRARSQGNPGPVAPPTQVISLLSESPEAKSPVKPPFRLVLDGRDSSDEVVSDLAEDELPTEN